MTHDNFMIDSLELSVMKEEVDSLLYAFVTDSLSSLYKTAYDKLAGFSDMKIYIPLFLHVYKYIRT